MKRTIEQILLSKALKDEMLKEVMQTPGYFTYLLELSILDIDHVSWRAAWLVNHKALKNDERINPYKSAIISSIGTKKDGHQRELIKLIHKIKWNEDELGEVFDCCISIWKDISKSSSVRIKSFEVLVKIVKSYPGLIQELLLFCDHLYTDELTPGILQSYYKLVNKIN